jgi:hypothetical protein
MATCESPHTANEFAKARRVHARNLLAFRTCATVKSLLKRQLLQAVPSTFLFETMDIELGYAQVSTLDLLDHLYINYGSVTTNKLSTNMETSAASGTQTNNSKTSGHKSQNAQPSPKTMTPSPKKQLSVSP